MVYLDHAASTPMLPEAIDAMAAQLAVGGNASSLHASGRRARRAVEESRERLAAGARRAARARSSSPAAAPRPTTSRSRASTGRGRPPTRAAAASWPAPSSTTPSSTRPSGSRAAQGAIVEWLPVDSRRPGVAGGAARGDRARPARRRAGLGDVGQQRGRHRDAGRRAGRDRPRVRHPAAHRRGAGGRPAAGRLRRQRRRRDDGDRPQARRTGRRRRPVARPRGRRRPRCCTAVARSATSARAPSTAPPIVGFAVAAELAVKEQPEQAERLDGAARRPGAPDPRRVPDAAGQRRPPDAAASSGCRATRTCRSPAARATRC